MSLRRPMNGSFEVQIPLAGNVTNVPSLRPKSVNWSHCRKVVLRTSLREKAEVGRVCGINWSRWS